MLLALDTRGPLYLQVYRALRTAILDDALPAGARLPSTRSLALENGISRNTAIVAYEHLCAEGYVRVQNGRTFVAPRHDDTPRKTEFPLPAQPDTPTPLRLSAYGRRIEETIAEHGLSWAPRAPAPRYDFRYGAPAGDAFPHATWSRLFARRLRDSKHDLDYGPPEGRIELRTAIAAYVQRARGIDCSPDEVIVVNGSQQALDLIARVLIGSGDAALIEDPYYRPARAVLETCGANLYFVPVDGSGPETDELDRIPTSCRLAYVTPSHQFPSGEVMTLSRRTALLAWAASRNCVVIEDDYDSEYTYDRRPLEALKALDRSGRVIYAGTFSKNMYPGLRLGYMIVPPRYGEVFRAAKAVADTGAPGVPQLALADFIEQGFFERHLRRTRTVYRERRAALLDSLTQCFGDAVEIAGAKAGLHVLARFPAVRQREAASFEQRARARDVGIYSAAPFYRAAPSTATYVLGFAALPVADIAEGVRRLAEVYADKHL